MGDGDTVVENRHLLWGTYFLVASGVFFVLHGIGFLYRTYYVEGFEIGVNDLGGVTAAELAANSPEIMSYINHLHVNVAGALIAMGVGMILLAWYGVRHGHRWAWAATIVIPLVFAAFSLPVHQTVLFDFDALIHLGPAAIGAPLLIAGAVLSYTGLRSVSER